MCSVLHYETTITTFTPPHHHPEIPTAKEGQLHIPHNLTFIQSSITSSPLSLVLPPFNPNPKLKYKTTPPSKSLNKTQIPQSSPSPTTAHTTATHTLPLQFFTKFPNAISSLDENPNVAVILLSGSGNHFYSCVDLISLSSLTVDVQSSSDCDCSSTCRMPLRVLKIVGNRCSRVYTVLYYGCVFSVKEVDLAITADLGSLQMLPAIVGFANAMELSLTATQFSVFKAKELGLLSKVFGLGVMVGWFWWRWSDCRKKREGRLRDKGKSGSCKDSGCGWSDYVFGGGGRLGWWWW
ncbi:putative enoyl-CoA hydratase/isomerase, ClpP/crotonase-like domain superfamily [Helianthus anomalus]